MQALENRMKAATGNADVAANAMAYVRAEAERLGLKFVTTAEGFSGFAASALRAGLTLDQTKGIFSGVSEAAAAMGLSSERVGYVFTALSQMASKGKVSMEELGQQLGESLPGALAIFATAMGKTTPEFMKMVEQGKVTVSDLTKLGDELHTQFGERAVESADSAQAAFNRLENALFEMKARFANAGILDAVTEGVEELTAALNDPQVQAGLMALAGLLADVAKAAVWTAAAIGNVAAQSRNIGKVGAAMHGINPNDVQRVQDKKAQEATFQQRMIAQTISNFNAKNAPAKPKVDGGYTLGTLAKPSDDAADKAAERARKKAEREAETARKKAEREAEAQARERKRLSGQVRDLGVSMGTPLDRQQAEFEDSQKLLEEALAKRAITKQKFDEMMAAAEADYREKQKEYVLEQFGSEADQEQARYEDKLKNLQEAKEAELLTEAEFNAAKEELEQQHLDNMSSIKDDAFSKMLAQEDAYREARKVLVDQTEAAVMGLLQTYANKNKTLAIAMLAFEKAKALQSIIISTQVAAAKAIEYYGPTPQGFAAAAAAYALGATAGAAVVAAGIQQASSLASGSNSSGKPGSAGTSFNSSTGQYEQNTTGGSGKNVTQVYFNIQGSDVSSVPVSEIRRMIERINEVQKDGNVVEFYGS